MTAIKEVNIHMKLAIVCGKSGIKIKSTLVSVRDSLEIDVFASITDLISNSVQRNYVYDRVLASSGIFRDNPRETLEELKGYLTEFGKDTRVVCLLKNNNTTLKQDFNEILSSPLYTTMTLDRITAKALEEAVTSSIDDIMEKYEPSRKVEVKKVQEVRDKRELTTLEQGVSPIIEPSEKEVSPKKKKKGLFSKLFGKGNVQTEEDSSELVFQENSSMGREINWAEEIDKTTDTSVNILGTEFLDSACDLDDLDGINTTDISVNSTLPENIKLEEESKNSNLSVKEPIFAGSEKSDAEIESVDSLSNSYEDDIDGDFFNPSNSESSPTAIQDGEIFNSGVVENIETSKEYTSDNDDFNISDDDFKLPDGLEDNTVDDNIDPLFIIGKEQNESTATEVVEQVADDNLDVVVGSEELEFEKRNTKVIEKKIIVGDNSSLLKKIEAGSRGTIILVTGDRGTGVTTNAINIASYFAKKTNVLYVDADVKNHGLLSYVNYDKILSYDSTQLQGIKLCKSKNLKDMCLIKYTSSLDLLTSDYGIEVTDRDLAQVQSTVVDISMDYGVVVLDVPFEQLNIFKDIISFH